MESQYTDLSTSDHSLNGVAITGRVEQKAASRTWKGFFCSTWRRKAGSTFASLLLLAGVAAAVVYVVHAMRTPHRPSPGHGRPIPPFYLYPPPTDTFPSSPLYTVAVQFLYSNGTAATPPSSSFVYYNSIDHRKQYPGAITAKGGQSVSWTAFAFDPTLVSALVTITTSFDIDACTLRPRSYGLTCAAATGGRTASILLNTTMLKISVELASASIGNTAIFTAQPLFLFPDPPEDPALVPAPTDSGVLYFARGVHNISGGQMSLGCGTNNVYLEPGAVVFGGFITTCNGSWFAAPEQVIMSGRGVISGEVFPWHDPRFQYALLNIDSGVNNVIDGLTVADSPEFYIASYAQASVIRNVKLLGSWTYNSDGFDTGNGGLVEDVFVKANDDCIKISNSFNGALVRRIVVWQMINGAAVQMGWLSRVASQGVLVQDIDVIHVDYCAAMADPTWCTGSNNDAVVDMAPDGTSSYGLGGITIENVRIEGDAVRLLYVQAAAGSSGAVTGLSMVNVHADAVSLRNGQLTNYIGSASATSSIIGVLFNNVTVGSACWRSASAAALTVAGAVQGVVFECPS